MEVTTATKSNSDNASFAYQCQSCYLGFTFMDESDFEGVDGFDVENPPGEIETYCSSCVEDEGNSPEIHLHTLVDSTVEIDKGREQLSKM